MRKHRVLFLAANPRGTDRLALDREARAITTELERSKGRDSFEFATRWAARPLDLLHELRALKPIVVHFSGHGGRAVASARPSDAAPLRDIGGGITPHDNEQREGLLFHAPDDGPQVVPAAVLADTFAAAGASVKVVLLNACYSEPLAEALLRHVDCVVGMAGSICDDAARRFAIDFHAGIMGRESIRAAYQQGCVAISLEGLPDAARPQLRVRNGVDASRLILAALPDARRRLPAALQSTVLILILVSAIAAGIMMFRQRDRGGTLHPAATVTVTGEQPSMLKIICDGSPSVSCTYTDARRDGAWVYECDQSQGANCCLVADGKCSLSLSSCSSGECQFYNGH